MARGSFSTPMTEDTIVEFGTVMKLLSLMNINSVGQSVGTKWKINRGRDARSYQRSDNGVWNIYRKYAECRKYSHGEGILKTKFNKKLSLL